MHGTPRTGVGHLADAEHYVVEQLRAGAAPPGAKDLERRVAILTWADTYSARLDIETARAKLWRMRASSPRRAARSTAAAASTSGWTKNYLLQGELEQAEEAFAEAERPLLEAGAVWAVGARR